MFNINPLRRAHYDNLPSSTLVNGNDRGEDDAGDSGPPSRLVLTGFSVLCIAFIVATTILSPTRRDRPNSSSASAASSLMQTFGIDVEDMPMEGKKRKRKGHHHKAAAKHNGGKDDYDIYPNEEDCNDGYYSKRTLKTAYELPFAALFRDNRGQKKFEASGVTVVDDLVYAVCDNSWAISRFQSSLTPFLTENAQIGDPDRVHGEDSGYEAIFHDDGIFYVVRESVQLPTDEKSSGEFRFNAVIEELLLGESDYDIMRACPSEYAFEGTSKGFEGAVGIRDVNNELVVLGLCEGNYCSEERKGERGNGRVIAMKKAASNGTDDGCLWETLAELKIPRSAHFRDYSSMSLTKDGRVAISSQEESQLWIGSLLGLDENGRFDVDKTTFDQTEGEIYSFAKSSECKTQYCNIEGIYWLNDEMFIGVSDKMKSKGKQDFRCFEKDQSVHVFVLP